MSAFIRALWFGSGEWAGNLLAVIEHACAQIVVARAVCADASVAAFADDGDFQHESGLGAQLGNLPAKTMVPAAPSARDHESFLRAAVISKRLLCKKIREMKMHGRSGSPGGRLATIRTLECAQVDLSTIRRTYTVPPAVATEALGLGWRPAEIVRVEVAVA
jgi:hypothetical protein